MKKLLFIYFIMALSTIVATEKAQIIEGLEQEAKKGSFASAVLLVEDAYESNVLPKWLEEHGFLWQELKKIDEMSFAAEWLNDKCCKELENIKETADAAWITQLMPSTSCQSLAKKLWLCQQLGKPLQQLEQKNYKKISRTIKEQIVELKALADQDPDASFRQDLGNLTKIIYDRCLNTEKNQEVKNNNHQLKKQYQEIRQLLIQRRTEIKSLKLKITKLLVINSQINACEAELNSLIPQ